jgi:hypothetical protein
LKGGTNKYLTWCPKTRTLNLEPRTLNLKPLLHPGISSLDDKHCGYQLPDGPMDWKSNCPEQQEQADYDRWGECADPRVFKYFSFFFPGNQVHLYYVDWFFRVDPINWMILPLGLSSLFTIGLNTMVQEIKRQNNKPSCLRNLNGQN